jgi:hypothetical protein
MATTTTRFGNSACLNRHLGRAVRSPVGGNHPVDVEELSVITLDMAAPLVRVRANSTAPFPARGIAHYRGGP